MVQTPAMPEDTHHDASDELAADDPHRRPPGASDELVEAVGQVTEALEWVERARGHLYDWHQMMGHADGLLGEAADALADAGADEQAERLRREIVGRNAIEGRWSFQVVEEFDHDYWQPLREAEGRVRDRLLDGRPHVLESEMKERRRTHGGPGHEARPPAPAP